MEEIMNARNEKNKNHVDDGMHVDEEAVDEDLLKKKVAKKNNNYPKN